MDGNSTYTIILTYKIARKMSEIRNLTPKNTSLDKYIFVKLHIGTYSY